LAVRSLMVIVVIAANIFNKDIKPLLF